MENNRNVYRLRSTPDLVLHLGGLSTDQLIGIEGHLLDQQQRVTADIDHIEETIGLRLVPPVEPPDIVA